MAGAVLALLVVACGPGGRGGADATGGGGGDGPPAVCPVCSEDKTAVIDCDGNATACPLDQACNEGLCMNACEAAAKNSSSVGCEYYAVDMDGAATASDACYTVFVANTSPGQVHIKAEWNGLELNLAEYAKLPQGQGQAVTYAPYDPVAGLAPGKVAILFLAYGPPGIGGNVTCPVPAAIGTDAQIDGTGFGKAFRITTDLPVVAYQMLPYGGGRAAVTGASLLIPTSAWGTSYVAVGGYEDPATDPPPFGVPEGPSYNIVATEDGTSVTLRPNNAIVGGGGLPAGQAWQPYTFTLNRGQYAQFTQFKGLSGSPVSADKPVGVFGGHTVMYVDGCCADHGEQMLAPSRALGSAYVAAPHADRKPSGTEPRTFRLYGAVNETHLVYDPPGIGPETINQGAMHEIRTTTPFTVRSQGSTHPFSMFTYMSGAGEAGEGGWGDADFVRLVPPDQFLNHYVFFTDPSYPFTALTVVRRLEDGVFEDVTLDCLAEPITGWQPVGTSGEYEIAFVKTVDHFVGQAGCDNGVRVLTSKGTFGAWVWGWGSDDTSTGWVSYGYPAGEGVVPINDVVILHERPDAPLRATPAVNAARGEPAPATPARSWWPLVAPGVPAW